MKVKRVVLVGAQAQGKSTFFNKITNQNEKTSYAGYSCTRQIVQGATIYGQGFEVIDTPGFDSQQDKLLHISGIIAALTYGTVNRVLIVTKYERNDSIIKNLELVFRPIHRYRSIVTVIFTHWDLCLKGSEEMEMQRIKELISKKFKLDSFLFFSQYDEANSICKAIEKILFSQNQEESIKLHESEIYKNFDIMELDCDNSDKLSDHVHFIQKEFRKIANIYIQFIKSLQTTNPHFQLILHEIAQKIKEEANIKVEEFEKKNGEVILQMVDTLGNNLQYLHYICLKKEIRLDVEKVIQSALQRMKESKFHFFNFLKRCPYCKEIWFKVVGCDGETTCGSRVYQANDGFLFVQPKKKIQLERNDKNELQCIVNQRADQNQRQEYLEQIFYFIQENKSLKQKVQDSNKLEEVLIKLFGDQYSEILIKKFINADINESSLIQKIETALINIEFDKSKQNVITTQQYKLIFQQPQFQQPQFLPKPWIQVEKKQNKVKQNNQPIKQSSGKFSANQITERLEQPYKCSQALLSNKIDQTPQTANLKVKELTTAQIIPSQPNTDLKQITPLKSIEQNLFQNTYLLSNKIDQTPQTANLKAKEFKTASIPSQPTLTSQQIIIPVQSPPLPQVTATQQKKEGVGCGKKLVWSQLDPLSQEELDQLFSTELLDYFADQEKIQKEETDWLNKTYKDIVNEAIANEKAKIKILEKKNQNQEQQIIQQL